MAAQPTSIFKFRAMQRLDEWSKDPATRDAVYGEAIRRLSDPKVDLTGPTVAKVEDSGSSDGSEPLDHFQRHWLSGDYFPRVPKKVINDTVREGFLAAIQDASKADLPLDVVWIRGNNDHLSGDFRVDHVVGPNAVTVAVITPDPQFSPKTAAAYRA